MYYTFCFTIIFLLQVILNDVIHLGQVNELIPIQVFL